jgi:hypothetical protein
VSEDGPRFVRRSDVLWRSVGLEVLVAEPETGVIESLNGPAGVAWLLLGSARSASELAGELAGLYESSADSIAGEIGSLLHDLEARGFVERARDR